MTFSQNCVGIQRVERVSGTQVLGKEEAVFTLFLPPSPELLPKGSKEEQRDYVFYLAVGNYRLKVRQRAPFPVHPAWGGPSTLVSILQGRALAISKRVVRSGWGQVQRCMAVGQDTQGRQQDLGAEGVGNKVTSGLGCCPKAWVVISPGLSPPHSWGCLWTLLHWVGLEGGGQGGAPLMGWRSNRVLRQGVCFP